MKKAIAALLSMFVGLFGYAIVDETMESRVTNLESVVSSQQDEIDSLHGIGKYSTTAGWSPITSSIDESSTESNTDWWIGWTTGSEDETYPWGGTDPTGYLTTVAEHPTDRYETTTAGTTNDAAVDYVGKTYRNLSSQSKFMFKLYSNGEIRYVGTGVPGDYAISLTTRSGYTTTTLPDEYEEYFAYVTDSSAVVTSKEQQTENITYYDNNYDVQTTVKYRNTFYTTLTVSGTADPVFAGKNISMDARIYRYDDDEGITRVTANNSVIAEDGSFQITYIYSSSTGPSDYSYYKINSLSIY